MTMHGKMRLVHSLGSWAKTSEPITRPDKKELARPRGLARGFDRWQPLIGVGRRVLKRALGSERVGNWVARPYLQGI